MSRVVIGMQSGALMSQYRRGDRITAVVSTLVAIAILAAGVTASSSRSIEGGRLPELEAAVRTQFELAFSANRPVHRQRVAQLDAALEAWRVADHSQENQAILVDWLETAIRHSMPGAVRPLPPRPTFVARPAPPPAPAPQSATAPAKASEANSEAPPQAAAASPATTARQSVLPRADRQAASAAPTRSAASSVAPAVSAAANPPVPTPAAAPSTRSAAAQPTSPTKAATPASKQRLATDASRPSASPKPSRNATASPAPRRTAPSPLATTPASGGPSPDASPSRSAERSAPQPPRAALVSTSPASTRPALPVDVNLRRLNAEIDDYNRQLQTLRRSIDLALGEPSTEQLSQWVEQLAAMCGRHEFVSLYYQGLREDERPLVLRPASPLPTARRLWEVTEKLAAGGDGDFLRAFDAQRGPALHDLQTRLQKLAERLADSDQ